jgi:hypothetical protein
MPLKIVNNDGKLSLAQIQAKMRDGYSVVKSPHVGNQHPSNLVCAALGIPFNVVTFTSGERDKNFHPHQKIVGGSGTQIANASTWTPFNYSNCGQTVESYHLDALQKVFPQLAVRTDMGLMRSEETLAESVLRVITNTVSKLWYRNVSTTGTVTKHRGDPVRDWGQISQDVFGLSNQTAGWVVPNRAHILFELVLQSIDSGRDTVYHLSGPQMVGYVGGIQNNLSTAYDALRVEFSELPETLTVHIVPVASCRMVTHTADQAAFSALEDVLGWYEVVPNEQKRSASERFAEVTTVYPAFTESIETGTFMSQYDIASVDDLLLSDWMMQTPLKRVEGIYHQLLRSARN